jgi:hypothetical protein
MEHVMEDLTNYGILPEHKVETDSIQATSSLLERVKIEVNRIMDDTNALDIIDKDSEAMPNEIPNQQHNSPKTPQPITETIVVSPPQTDTPPIVIRVEPPLTSEVKASTPPPKKPSEPTLTQSVVGIPHQGDAIQRASLFDNDLLLLLRDMGVQYTDNRTTGSYLWIIDSPEKHDSIENALKTLGRAFQFEKRGSITTGNKPAWRTK